MVFRTRDLLVRQRSQLINAIRGHLTEFGWVAPKRPSHVSVLASLLEEGEEIGASLPEAACAMFLVMTGQLEQLGEQVALLDKEIARRAREDEAARRLMTIPGIGQITATAILALAHAPSPESFAKGRASGSGLRQDSTRAPVERGLARFRRWARARSAARRFVSGCDWFPTKIEDCCGSGLRLSRNGSPLSWHVGAESPLVAF